MNFHDHFSDHAADYAAARPDYPPALFQFLADASPHRDLAWDVGAGSGQAAVASAAHFQKVIATDASAEQLAAATPHQRVEYRAAPAEASGLENGSVDLVTVAQALHWFNLDAFYAEVRRVTRRPAVIAVWCYELQTVSPAFDEVLLHFYREIVGPYWPPERRHIEARYTTLAFPFRELKTPEFAMEHSWTLGQLLAYLNTWSAVKRYEKANGQNPLELVELAFLRVWGDANSPHKVRWPLTLKVGVID